MASQGGLGWAWGVHVRLARSLLSSASYMTVPTSSTALAKYYDAMVFHLRSGQHPFCRLSLMAGKLQSSGDTIFRSHLTLISTNTANGQLKLEHGTCGTWWVGMGWGSCAQRRVAVLGCSEPCGGSWVQILR